MQPSTQADTAAFGFVPTRPHWARVGADGVALTGNMADTVADPMSIGKVATAFTIGHMAQQRLGVFADNTLTLDAFIALHIADFRLMLQRSDNDAALRLALAAIGQQAGEAKPVALARFVAVQNDAIQTLNLPHTHISDRMVHSKRAGFHSVAGVVGMDDDAGGQHMSALDAARLTLALTQRFPHIAALGRVGTSHTAYRRLNGAVEGIGFAKTGLGMGDFGRSDDLKNPTDAEHSLVAELADGSVIAIMEATQPELRQLMAHHTADATNNVKENRQKDKHMTEQKKPVVVLDIGHLLAFGNAAKGAAFNGKHGLVRELDINISQSHLLARALELRGFEVQFTHLNEHGVPMEWMVDGKASTIPPNYFQWRLDKSIQLAEAGRDVVAHIPVHADYKGTGSVAAVHPESNRVNIAAAQYIMDEFKKVGIPNTTQWPEYLGAWSHTTKPEMKYQDHRTIWGDVLPHRASLINPTPYDAKGADDNKDLNRGLGDIVGILLEIESTEAYAGMTPDERHVHQAKVAEAVAEGIRQFYINRELVKARVQEQLAQEEAIRQKAQAEAKAAAEAEKAAKEAEKEQKAKSEKKDDHCCARKKGSKSKKKKGKKGRRADAEGMEALEGLADQVAALSLATDSIRLVSDDEPVPALPSHVQQKLREMEEQSRLRAA